MSDIFSVLQSALRNGTADPGEYQVHRGRSGELSGQLDRNLCNNQKFDLTIENVNGFRAQVKYQSGSTVQYGRC